MRTENSVKHSYILRQINRFMMRFVEKLVRIEMRCGKSCSRSKRIFMWSKLHVLKTRRDWRQKCSCCASTSCNWRHKDINLQNRRLHITRYPLIPTGNGTYNTGLELSVGWCSQWSFTDFIASREPLYTVVDLRNSFWIIVIWLSIVVKFYGAFCQITWSSQLKSSFDGRGPCCWLPRISWINQRDLVEVRRLRKKLQHVWRTCHHTYHLSLGKRSYGSEFSVSVLCQNIVRMKLSSEFWTSQPYTMQQHIACFR